ncbi:MAG TPA: Ig-like domain-containing protein [Blastocatellia bacterium]|nr:Ig-like domain-containing protein [Blastocatellia bacterium]
MISNRKVSPVAKLLRIILNGSHRRLLIAAGLVVTLAIGAGAFVKRAILEKPFAQQSALPTVPPAQHSHYVMPAATAMFDISNTPVTTVSAAAFEQVPVAPDSIVTAFGTQLASSIVIANDADPNTPGIQLPTDLAGTTVEVNGRKAGLFFVSPTQINYMMPAATESGTANVVVKFGQTISNGTVMVSRVAPGIFTANSNGRGVPAATVLRVKQDGTQRYESLYQFNQQALGYITKPIDVPSGDLVVLVLFLTGIRNAADVNNDGDLKESIKVLIGGVEATVLGASRQPDFVGLDQINAVIPTSLVGRGIVDVSVIGLGYNASNVVKIEIAGNGGVQPPVISGFGSTTALAGSQLTINGQGFSAVKEENFVRINGLDVPTVMEASPTQLKVLVPFNVESGTVSVRTPQGEGQSISTLQVITSISGFVENTNGLPLSNVPVKLQISASQTITATTNSTGAFVLPDVPPGAYFVDFDGGALQSIPPYPKWSAKITAFANRDNQFSRNVVLQQESGSSGTIGGGSFSGTEAGNGETTLSPAQPTQQSLTIQTDEYQLIVPPGTKVIGPNKETSVKVTLTALRNARTPVELPLGYFSSAIVQITPFNYTLEPGAKLILPNLDKFPAGTLLTLFRFDKDSGKFVEEKGGATVSSDGKRIETTDDAIKVTSYYFASAIRNTTTVVGRVINTTGKPVKSQVRSKGQISTTDGNGSYVLRFIPATDGEVLTVDGSTLLPSQNVVKTPNVSAPAKVGDTTKMPDLILPDESKNNPPDIDVQDKITVTEGKTLELVIIIRDRDPGQTIASTSVSGADFVSLAKIGFSPGANSYYLRFTPNFSQAGNYIVTVTASDNLGAVTKADIAVTVIDANRTAIATGQSVTLDEDSTVAIKLSATDEDGDKLTYKIVSSPSNGVLTGTAPEMTYKPNPNFNGTDRFTFVANDGKSDSAAATVSITVTPINDPPFLTVPGAQTVNKGQLLQFAVSASDPDAGQTVTITATGLPEGATFTSVPAGGGMQFRWTPNSNQAGTYTISFKATDNGSPVLSDTKEVRITVQ